MTRKTRRSIEQRMESVADGETADRGGIVVKTTAPHPRDDSPHPELTVEAYPDTDGPDGFKVATPKIWPQPYASQSVLCVEACRSDVGDTWPEPSDPPVRPCDLWDKLTDAQLREEYEIRKQHGDPIPAILDQYDPEE